MKSSREVASLTKDWTQTDWQIARLEVQLHGVAPLLYERFSDNGSLGLLNQLLRDYIESQYLLNGKRIERVQEVLHSVLSVSDEAGIKIMPLKGSVLVNEYYNNPAIRPMADIDLLIDLTDEKEEERILTSLGYHLLSDTSINKTYISDDSISSIVGEHPDNPIKIELHTRVFCKTNQEQYDFTELMWQNSSRGFLKLNSIKTPSKAMLLLHVLLHASCHQYEGTLRAIQLHDIFIISRIFDDYDWLAFEEQVDTLGCGKMIYLPLFLCAVYFEISVPESTMNMINVKTPTRLKRLKNSYSLSEFIAFNETQTLKYLTGNINNSLYKRALLKAGILVSKLFILSIQFEYCSSRKGRIRESMNLLVPPSYRIERYGYFIGVIISIFFFAAITLTNHLWLNRLRQTIVNSLKLYTFRHEAKHEDI